MKKISQVIFATMLVSVLSASAQSNSFNRGGQQRSGKAGMQEIDFTTEPSIAPSGKVDVNEFMIKRKDLQEQVVELTFDKVVSLKQFREGYVAMVTFEKPRLTEGLDIFVPSDGLELFEDLSKPEVRRRESVYVEVVSPVTLKVLGTRYRKDKPEGERYGW